MGFFSQCYSLDHIIFYTSALTEPSGIKMFLSFSPLQILYKIFGDERIHNMYVVQQSAFERPSHFLFSGISNCTYILQTHRRHRYRHVGVPWPLIFRLLLKEGCLGSQLCQDVTKYQEISSYPTPSTRSEIREHSVCL